MFLLSVLIYLRHVAVGGRGGDFEENYYDVALRLRADLLVGYDKVVPPVSRRDNDYSQAGADVGIELSFVKAETVYDSLGLMNLKAWVRMSWIDERLSWIPEHYGNITQTQFHAAHWNAPKSTEIWLPDIQLWNANDGTIFSLEPAGAVVHSDGSVFWSRPGLLKVMCRFSGLVAFPYDRMKCLMEFGGLSFSGGYQGIYLINSNGLEWSLEESLAKTSYSEQYIHDVKVRTGAGKYYASNPREPWPTVIYTVTLGRSSLFFFMTIVLPSTLVTIVSFGTFWMSPATHERLVFGISISLTMNFMRLAVTIFLPVCGELLWLDFFLLMCSLFSLLSLVSSMVSLYLFFDKRRKHVILDRLTKVGCCLCCGSIARLSLVSEAAHIYKDMHAGSKLEASPAYEATNCIDDVSKVSVTKKLMHYERMFDRLDAEHTGCIDFEEFATVVSFVNLRLSVDQIGASILDRRAHLAPGNSGLRLCRRGPLIRNDFMQICADPDVLGNIPLKEVTIGLEIYLTVRDLPKLHANEKYRKWSKTLDRWMRIVIPVSFATVMGFMANLHYSDGYIEGEDSLEHRSMFEGWGKISFSTVGFLKSCITPAVVIVCCLAGMRVKQLSKSKLAEAKISSRKNFIRHTLRQPSVVLEMGEEFKIEESLLPYILQPLTSAIGDLGSDDILLEELPEQPYASPLVVESCKDLLAQSAEMPEARLLQPAVLGNSSAFPPRTTIDL